ncbi:MAG: N-6 DNA methylase [Syntrophobacteraceae bacterium]|jgi:HD superfamily phosphohydrolase/adenine-specific DNA methylase
MTANLNQIDTNLEQWLVDRGFEKILMSDPVQRLKRIRFLGTMQYFVDLEHFYTRYDHSLSVAKLADTFSKRARLGSEMGNIVVLMALIHDIGHLPFSHASEVFFRQTWGKYHTGHGSRLVHHLASHLKIIGEIDLAKMVRHANALLAGHLEKDSYERKVAYQIFHGTVSADNLDGITRAARSIGLPAPEPTDIISGISRREDQPILSHEAQQLVIEFFELQKKVYLEYVYSANGLSAEAMMTRALEITFPKSSSDRNEFLSLDDSSTLERCHDDSRSRELIQMLEAKMLFASLREIAPEKHKLISALSKRMPSEIGRAIPIRKILEATLCETLNLPEPLYFICHSTIRHRFPNLGPRQRHLFRRDFSLEKTNRDLRSSKSYEDDIDIFLPTDTLSNVRFLSIPRSLKYSAPYETCQPDHKTELEKHRGAYTTPRKIVQFIVDWTIRKKDDTIFDPASGDGIFLRVAYERLLGLGATSKEAVHLIFGVETDHVYWENNKRFFNKIASASKHIINEDYFSMSSKSLGFADKPRFDVIVANPPYIRAHRFQGDDRERAIRVAEQCGVRLSQRISSWAPYVVNAVTMLKPNGRIGMVLPTELLSADYAEPVRRFLKQNFSSLHFVFFNKFVFSGVQQDVLLLLASNDGQPGIFRTSVQDKDSLSVETVSNAEKQVVSSKWLSSKWTNLLADQSIQSLLDTLLDRRQAIAFEELASVSIGLVTGCNEYFILSPSMTHKHSIKDEWLTPIIAKAASIPGALIDPEDFDKLASDDKECYLLQINTSANVASDIPLAEYLKEGKRRGIEQKYKCRTRWPWYSVPMQSVPDAFITYMSGNFVRLVINRANVHSTNTIHNVRFKEQLSQRLIYAYTVSFYSSFSLLSTELIGRVYGGGVLKLEPGDTRKILLPNLGRFNSEIINELASLLKDLDRGIRSGSLCLFEEIDRLVMYKGLGLSESDCIRIREERERLRRRRMLRYLT